MKALFLSIFISAILVATPLFGATFNIAAGDTAGFQAALTSAQASGDDVINVAAGTYNITATLTYSASGGGGLTIRGAGAGSTILIAVGSVQIMKIADTGSSGGDVSISGLTFQDGHAAVNGGGVRVDNNSGAIILTDNIFTGNSAAIGNGGGVYAYSGSAAVTLTGNTFTGNSSGQQGGGAYAYSDSAAVILTGNTFTGNSSPQGGGALVYSASGSIAITDNVFAGNDSPDATDPFEESRGGGLFAQSDISGPLTITNNTFYGNTCFNYGGGVYLFLSNNNVQANVYNNIFWTNVASNGGNDGDDLYVKSDVERPQVGSVALFNNDFSGNANFATGQSEDLFITDTTNYTHPDPETNIQADPLFVNSGSGNFHLQSGSPAIDVGDNSAPSLPVTDFDGKPRIINGIVDMGAYEYGSATAIPTMNEWGIMVFMVLAGLGGVYYLRRQRIA